MDEVNERKTAHFQSTAAFPNAGGGSEAIGHADDDSSVMPCSTVQRVLQIFNPTWVGEYGLYRPWLQVQMRGPNITKC